MKQFYLFCIAVSLLFVSVALVSPICYADGIEWEVDNPSCDGGSSGVDAQQYYGVRSYTLAKSGTTNGNNWNINLGYGQYSGFNGSVGYTHGGTSYDFETYLCCVYNGCRYSYCDLSGQPDACKQGVNPSTGAVMPPYIEL